MNLYKKCTAKSYSFLVIDATLAFDNLLPFRKNFSEKKWKLIMAIDDKIRDGKSQYDVNRGAAKISALSWGEIINIDILQVKKYKRRVTEQAKFTYSPLRAALAKKTKTEDQGKKQIKTMKYLVEKQIQPLEIRFEKVLSDRSKINHFFVFKTFSKWRTNIRIKQNCLNGK